MIEIFNPVSNSDRNKKMEMNLYGKEKFLPETAKEKVESLISEFKKYYGVLGYSEEPSIPISSGMDPTVRFIGSHISVFKPYLVENIVPSPGLYMRQDCLRTRNADKLLDDDYFPEWGSYFQSIGVITPPGRLREACKEALAFFEDKLSVSPENILIRIRSTDHDLVDACRNYYGEDAPLEIDSRNPEYYKHRIGIEGIRGRNFNIALKNPTDNGFSDVGNIILLEDDEKQICIETALGVTTILKQLYGLDHVQDCTPVIGLRSKDENIRRKFEDAIITSVILFREGLRPFGKHNRNRILKQYVRSLSYFRAKSEIDMRNLLKIISDFEKREFPGTVNLSADIIVEFVKSFEEELNIKKILTNDEKKIRDALNL